MKRAEAEGPTAGGGGDACCGGGGPPTTPDGIIALFLPQLTETLMEILSDKPFNNNTELKGGNGESYNYKA